MTLNVPQTIFTIFFAIFWGTVSNAWPRWKPFHWSLACRERKVRARLILAFSLLNVLPLCVVGVILFFISRADVSGFEEGTLLQWLAVAWVGAFPAFTVFGISRMFVGILGMWPETFYLDARELKERGLACDGSYAVEPSVQSLSLDKARSLAFSDFMVGALHVLIPGLVALFSPAILAWLVPAGAVPCLTPPPPLP